MNVFYLEGRILYKYPLYKKCTSVSVESFFWIFSAKLYNIHIYDRTIFVGDIANSYQHAHVGARDGIPTYIHTHLHMHTPEQKHKIALSRLLSPPAMRLLVSSSIHICVRIRLPWKHVKVTSLTRVSYNCFYVRRQSLVAVSRGYSIGVFVFYGRSPGICIRKTVQLSFVTHSVFVCVQYVRVHRQMHVLLDYM